VSNYFRLGVSNYFRMAVSNYFSRPLIVTSDAMSNDPPTTRTTTKTTKWLLEPR
jgi:hypothetical protein